ncbi:ABC transporter substrate-binding protein [Kribbella sp. NPDC050241]|uniref:ABC transporter substrate-binding protein n=1 Tax=Kribbella sp. NPDC050241 TaxID=3364115 RepID=UPI0037AB3203
MPPDPRSIPSGLSRRAFLGALGAAGLGLYGCGGQSTTKSSSGGTANLQFMYWGSANEKAAIEQMMQAFQKSHSGVKVQPVHVPGDYETKVNTLVASGNLPDVAYMAAPTAYRLAEQGKIANIYPYIEKYAQLSGRKAQNFFWYGDKKVAGTPAASEISLLWYNKDLIPDASMTPPATADQAWSWDKLLEAATALTLDQNGKKPSDSGFKPDSIRQFGISAPLTTQWTWYPLIRSNGGDVADETGTKYMLNSPECVKVFQDLQDLVYKHRVAPSPAQLGGGDGGNAPTTTVQLQTKRVAMAIDGQWTLLDMGESNLKYGIGVLPSYQEPITQEAGSCRVMSATTKHPEQAMELYAYSVDGSNSDLFKKGLWMPVETKYYSDDASIESWTKNDVHPPEYRTAAVDYRLNHSVRDFTQVLKNVPAIQEVLTPAIEQIATGKASAKAVLDGLEAKIQPLLQGRYPIPNSI